MADDLRGDGLYDVHDALARLAQNTALLDRALQRFGRDGDDDELPPPYSSPSSSERTPTEPDAPRDALPLPANVQDDDDPDERLFQRRLKLSNIHANSQPMNQFERQTRAFALRLAQLRYNEQRGCGLFPLPGTPERFGLVNDQLKEAEGIIRARWKDQGIWMDTWGTGPGEYDRWQHEMQYRRPYWGVAEGAQPRKRRTRATVAAAATAPSRPFNQFVYQVGKERDLLLGLVGDLDALPLPKRKHFADRTIRPGDMPGSFAEERAKDEAYEQRRLQSMVPPVPAPLRKAPVDVHSIAYETVKAAWVRWGIWDPRWTVMPGLRWMHEEPFNKFLERRLAEEDGGEWVDDDGEVNERDEEEEGEEPGKEQEGQKDKQREEANPLPQQHGDIVMRQGEGEQQRPPITGGSFLFSVPRRRQDDAAGGPSREQGLRERSPASYGIFGGARGQQPAADFPVGTPGPKHYNVFGGHNQEPSAQALFAPPSAPPSPPLPPPPPAVALVSAHSPEQPPRRGQRRGRGQRQTRLQEGGLPAAPLPPPSPPLPPAPLQPEEPLPHEDEIAQDQPSPPRRSKRVQARVQALAEEGPSRPGKRARGAASNDKNDDNDDNNDGMKLLEPAKARQTRAQAARKRRRGP